ncbi:Uncharacterised protein [Bordetella pertussis]|nr:Uncharacterised protein [Bordetella pertussis]
MAASGNGWGSRPSWMERAMLNSLSRRSRFDICAIRARTLWCSCSFMNRNDSASCPTSSRRRRGRHATDGGTRIGSVRSWVGSWRA